MAMLRIRLGTRASALARWQAEWVAARLVERGLEVELVPITTAGDRHQQQAIGEFGERGLFTKEIQRALLEGRIDLAVHSLKDLPTDEVAGLALAACPRRAAVADVLVCRGHGSLGELPPGALVGTGSLRRRAQILHLRPDLKHKDIRGNVDTRLRKLAQGDYDAILLAQAGLERLGLILGEGEVGARPQDRQLRIRVQLSAPDGGERTADFRAERLGPPAMLPAIGQGALGLETRSDDRHTRQAVEQLNDPATWCSVLAERAMLAALEGGCLAPIAAWGRLENGQLVLTGRVLDPDGRRKLETTLPGDPAEPGLLGRRVADQLLAQGAQELIEASRRQAY